MKRYPEFILRLKDRRGVTIILVAILMSVFLGFAALAIDIGHLYVVRNELQNAADAAAMAGARVLYPNTPPTTPNWDLAEATATAAIQLNKSDGNITLKDGQVQSGYWNLARTPFGLQGQGITPGTTDSPAVKVTISRSAGNNGGSVGLFFAPIFGTNFSSVSATATAVMSFPGHANANKGTLFPVAISKELADKYTNYVDSNHTFRIGSSYHYPTTDAGQWTSFELDKNNVPTVRDLIANGNPTPLGVGDDIWIEPGTKTTLYSSVLDYATNVSRDVVLPIVNGDLETHADMTIVGFIGFHIIDSVGGSGKYIEGYFNTGIMVGGMGPAGPDYGLYTPPVLVY